MKNQEQQAPAVALDYRDVLVEVEIQLDDTGLANRAVDLSQALEELDDLAAALADFKVAHKLKKTQVESEVDRLRQEIDTGKAKEMVEAKEFYLWNEGKAVTRRGEEVLSERPLTDEEKQTHIGDPDNPADEEATSAITDPKGPRAEGRAAFAAGEAEIKCPYPLGDPNRPEWLGGWNDAWAESGKDEDEAPEEEN